MGLKEDGQAAKAPEARKIGPMIKAAEIDSSCARGAGLAAQIIWAKDRMKKTRMTKEIRDSFWLVAS